MENDKNRNEHLKEKLNKHLCKLTKTETDYYSKLTADELMELKSALSDINNVLTLKMTVSAIDWICKYFKLDLLTKKSSLKDVYEQSPNSNGFDIKILKPIKLLAEVKCINPFSNGNKFGAAQWNSILDDAIKLKNGKGKLSDTKNYYKLLFLADLGIRTDLAIDELLRVSKATAQSELRINRHAIKSDVVLFDNKITGADLLKNKVYIIKLKLK